jgi:two-component system chemotaxis response regulator CheY
VHGNPVSGLETGFLTTVAQDETRFPGQKRVSNPTGREPGMRALVIDDSRTVRAIIGKILRDEGLEVVEAANGREGLERLREPPGAELVLVDWNMPEMNGLEFIKAVRAERAFDAVRIMMVTTETEQDQVIRALDAGANEYVMKPFTREILVAKLSLLDALGE